MPLQKQALKNGIKQLLTDMRNREQNTDEEFATRLTNLIDAFVKSGTVTVAVGITVATTGSATAQTGATTSTGTGTIS